jgi:hypothetical protein
MHTAVKLLSAKPMIPKQVLVASFIIYTSIHQLLVLVDKTVWIGNLRLPLGSTAEYFHHLFMTCGLSVGK